MPVYRRETRVRAPLDRVWEFHSTTDGLEALTPDFLGLEIEAVYGPDGEPDPEVLEAGSRIESSTRPFGVVPGGDWISVIERREEHDGSAFFVDTMDEGPFPRWEHTHTFHADGDETIVRDRVEYDLPLGEVGRAVGPLAWVGFEPMFRYRHRRTKELLEDETA
jgi:ligand-binding SRPBCC domain-containing protein